MPESDRDALIRSYAVGDVTWRTLRARLRKLPRRSSGPREARLAPPGRADGRTERRGARARALLRQALRETKP
jgi:hypothetical protein